VDEGHLDSDGDLLADCVDPDDDNDQVPDPLDCAPLVNSVSSVPGEVGQTLRTVPGAPTGTFSWIPISQANVHNVYRGSWNGSGTISSTLVCLAPESPRATFTDVGVPPPNTIYYYLITGTNSCGEGGAGSSSSGQPFPIPARCQPRNLDTDLDGVRDLDDNCPVGSNAAQADGDHDGRGDACDNCGGVVNPGQEDADGNGAGDHCQDVDADGYPVSEDCNDLEAAVHPGAAEACNGRDDDCDAVADEDLGATACGIGACQRSVQACVDGVPQTCTPGDPTAETCNDVDDDCDGSTDEGLGSTTCGIGACERTVSNCAGGAPQTCTPGTPAAETCNGADDDCDGSADEGFLDTDGDGLADCFDDDDDGDAVPDTSDNCPLAANSGQADLDVDGLGDACDQDADGDTFRKTGTGSPVQTVASSEQRLQGSQTGTIAATQVSDNTYETIRETSGTSMLDMRWTFNVPAGHLSVVFVEAHQTVSNDGDNFVFAYSTDGTNFTDMLVVRKTADDNLAQYFALPAGTSGAIVIRARDTNRTSGTSRDTLSVDRIHVVTSDPADCNDLSAGVSPAANEGPTGAGTCSDGIDNNCDARIDGNDANCR
jgi:hypothetical protein